MAKVDFVVLKNGKIIDYNKIVENTNFNGHYTKTPYIDGNDLVYLVTRHWSNGISSCAYHEPDIYIGKIDYTYTKQDIKDAEMLLFMEKYFPNLKPVKVSKAVKRLMKEMKADK